MAGLVALDEGGALVGAGSMRDQTLHICRTIEDICPQQGAELTAVARCLVFITDRARYAEFDTAFAEVFGEHRPARATMIADLVNPEFLVEIISDIELPAERRHRPPRQQALERAGEHAGAELAVLRLGELLGRVADAPAARDEQHPRRARGGRPPWRRGRRRSASGVRRALVRRGLLEHVDELGCERQRLEPVGLAQLELESCSVAIRAERLAHERLERGVALRRGGAHVDRELGGARARR